MVAKNTEREIRLAIARIRHQKLKRIEPERKLSIASVAAEAGISNATIHNRYPQLADEIRKLQKEGNKIDVTKKRTELDEMRLKNGEIRQQLNDREEALRKLANVNLRMAQEIKVLKATLQEQNGNRKICLMDKRGTQKKP